MNGLSPFGGGYAKVQNSKIGFPITPRLFSSGLCFFWQYLAPGTAKYSKTSKETLPLGTLYIGLL